MTFVAVLILTCLALDLADATVRAAIGAKP